MNGVNIGELVKFEKSKQIIFGYLASIRALPNILYFVEKYQFGTADIFTSSIEMLYDSIFDFSHYSEEEIERQLQLVFDSTPDTNDFGTYDGTIAMCSTGVIHTSLRLLSPNSSLKELTDISTLLIDAVDCFIQERNDMDSSDFEFEERISADPMMANEFNIQYQIIDAKVTFGKEEKQSGTKFVEFTV